MTQKMLIYLTITFVIALLAWLAWHHLPIAKVQGYTIYPKDWARTRTNRQWEGLSRRIDAARSLPHRERAKPLLKLFEEYRSQPLLPGNSVCMHIVALGQDDLLPFISERLNEGEFTQLFHLRSVIIGIKEALATGTAQPHFKVQCFQMLLPFLDRKSHHMSPSGADMLPDVLFLLDADWAKRVLTSPEYLTPDHHLLKDVLIALRKHRVDIPQSLIDSWLENMDRSSLGYKGTMAYIEVANIIGTYDRDKADQLLVQLLHIHYDADKHVATARLELRDIPDPLSDFYDKKERVGFQAFNPYERTAWLVIQYNHQYNTGGLTHFEEYDEPEHLPLMIEALTELKAPKSAEELRQFFAIYGPDGITPASIERIHASDASREEHYNKVNEFEAITDRGTENTEYMVLNYILENAQHFDAKPDPVATSEDAIQD